MDPQETWREILDAYANCRWSEARDAATSLRQWLDRGGFPPQTLQPQIGAALDRAIACAVCKFVLAEARRRGRR